MTRSRLLPLAAVLCALVLSGRADVPTARADIPPPPDSPITKRVPIAIEVDWGVFADRVTRKHVVVAGDTLRSLAAKYLGDKERFQVIANANATLAANPDRIRVGDTLWIPPPRHAEKPPPPVASDQTAPLGPWYDAFWQVWNRRNPPLIGSRASPGEVPEAARRGGTLVFVPHAEASPLLAAGATEAAEPPQGVLDNALYAALSADTLVHKDDPTVRIVEKHKLAGLTNRLVQVETERLRYDAAGALVTRVWNVPRPSFDTVETSESGGGSAPSTPTPSATPEGEPAEPPRPPTFAPASTPLAVPTGVPTAAPGAVTPVPASAAPTSEGVRSAPIASEASGGAGGGSGTKAPISPLVLIVASLVGLALIGVVVLLRRGARAASAGSLPPPAMASGSAAPLSAAHLPATPLPAVHPPLDSPTLSAPLSFSPSSPSEFPTQLSSDPAAHSPDPASPPPEPPTPSDPPRA